VTLGSKELTDLRCAVISVYRNRIDSRGSVALGLKEMIL